MPSAKTLLGPSCASDKLTHNTVRDLVRLDPISSVDMLWCAGCVQLPDPIQEHVLDVADRTAT